MADGRTNLNRSSGARQGVAILALLAGASAIGFAPVFTRLAMNRELGPSATAMWRVALAAPLFWGQLLIGRSAKKAPLAGLSKADVLSLLLPGVLFAGDLAFWHWSIKFTTVANATLLANFAAVFVALAGWLWLRERLRWGFVVGLVLALAGAAVLLRASFALSARYLLGDVWGLVTALFYAAYQLSIKRLRGRFGVAQILGASAFSSTACLAVISWASGERMWPAAVGVWALLIGLAWISHYCGQGMIALAFGHLPASFSSVSLLFQPLVAAAAGWVILGESLGAGQIAGGAAVIVGIALARRGSTAER